MLLRSTPFSTYATHPCLERLYCCSFKLHCKTKSRNDPVRLRIELVFLYYKVEHPSRKDPRKFPSAVRDLKNVTYYITFPDFHIGIVVKISEIFPKSPMTGGEESHDIAGSPSRTMN